MHSPGRVTATLIPAGNKANDAIDQITRLDDVAQPLLSKLKIFTEVVDKIAEVHPYAKMAWSVLSAAHKTILAQSDRDDRIQQLYEIMDNVYAIVIQAETSEIESHKKVIGCMVRQTTECGYFITSYAKNKNFWLRLAKNAISGADIAIENFRAKFEDLKKEFHEEAVRSTEITVMRTEILAASILDEVKNLATEVDLKDLPYANDARFRSDKQCLAGTRDEVLDEITNWINSSDDSKKNVFLLCGAAGTGKSAIAHTIAKRFDLLGHLGSSYCFMRSNQANRHPGNLFSTIAVDLANHSPQFKIALHAGIHSNRSLCSTQDVATQFENFILKPTKNLTMTGPIVIVIDALDECGDTKSRQTVISALATQSTMLPANVHILLTSRMEEDIMDFFFHNTYVIVKHMEEIECETTRRDIHTYICRQLTDPHGQPFLGFTNANYDLLVEKSEGLFQWAYVVCDAISCKRAGLPSPYKRFQQFTTMSSDKGPLDSLYSEVLNQLFQSDVIHIFKSVMGWIMSAFEPLSVDTLAKMRSAANNEDNESSSRDVIASIVKFMGSLLSGVSHDHISVQVLHTSFRDFLTDQSRSGEFYVNTKMQHTEMSLACLNIMNMELCFNICKLETSYQLNNDVCDLNNRIKKYISPQLSYSCKFWMKHLQKITVPRDPKFQRKCIFFLKQQVLYWLEVLSVLKEVNIAPRMLSLVLKQEMVSNIIACSEAYL
ncbi:hypothetical protein BD410DRAFT_718554 [Rickenella mellea]|uniref:Nephrocystin 3-like N-terminal domain-containing protein n=1 Tax=Rickenella mellea TaxID=50990 RepID=A0A4Y7QC70_9AGAM|nr:hypothetical protein BD410DRAFT_718554 [Rickenella mellea]